MGAKGIVFRVWAHEWVPLNLQWLVLRIGGADFLDGWVANSIWLERTESLITISNSLNGSLFGALTKFTMMLCVNNSFICCVWPASSWPCDSLPLVLILHLKVGL